MGWQAVAVTGYRWRIVRAIPAPWDSDVFGYRVGLLAAAPADSIEAIAEANRGLFDVVFVKSEGWGDPGAGAVAVDYLYDMERMELPAPSCIKEVLLTPLSARHMEIARTAFRDSRFLRDPRLSIKAPEMYSRWLFGKEVHVLEGAIDDAFLLATEDADGVRRISLIAVDERRRGSGTGRALLDGTIRRERPATWRVRVSSRNHGAIRFYEGAGFRVRNVRTAFHVWTDGRMG